MSNVQVNSRRSIRRWIESTSNRTFILYPLGVIIFEVAVGRKQIGIEPWGVVLLLWGYLQYRLVGKYRVGRGGGGPGLDKPPKRIVEHGPYYFVRNPMYLGHLIFMLGLAVTFTSWVAAGLFLIHVFWFDVRVRKDEARLEELFGANYRDYKSRVKRWIPGLI